MTTPDTQLVKLKFRADDLSDAANLAYWMPESQHHKETLKDTINAMKAILQEMEAAQ